MSELRKTSCCGVRDYNGLLEFDTPKEVLLDLHPRLYNGSSGWRSGAFIMFTCPAMDRKIPRLIDYITEQALGTCTLAPTLHNPNSQRNLQVLMWGIDHRAYARWYETNFDEGHVENAESDVFEVGDRVQNDNRDSARYGLEAVITRIFEEDDTIRIEVRYDNGRGTGEGEEDDYTLI